MTSSASTIAKRDNVGAPAYAKKLNYCLAVMHKCAAGDKGAP